MRMHAKTVHNFTNFVDAVRSLSIQWRNQNKSAHTYLYKLPKDLVDCDSVPQARMLSPRASKAQNAPKINNEVKQRW